MKFLLLWLSCLLIVVILIERTVGNPYFDDDTDMLQMDDSFTDYTDNTIEDLMRSAQQKRSSLIHLLRGGCIRRGGNCDHRPKDCCYSSSCRCNLWGSNCRCQRVGLFQKWG